MKEIVGFDSWRDVAAANRETRRQRKREVETKVILSRDDRGWNFSSNVMAEKNLNGGPFEFGYALGTSHPLATNLTAGIEAYGGLGESSARTLSRTSHYIAPAIAWSLSNDVTIRFSPAFGLTADSNRLLVRFGVSYDIDDLRSLHR